MKLLHLSGPYALTLCRLPLGEIRQAGLTWPKGSFPTQDKTCLACWDFKETACRAFGFQNTNLQSINDDLDHTS